MTAEEFEKEWCNGFVFDVNQRYNLMIEFAKIKCQELLKIVAEKAEDHFTHDSGYGFESKDSILNSVDLDEFIR